ncbi:MAG: acylneuraminate cytidylyltransferase family protein [Bacteroidetes bacterium]|nr:acylneuraminate cytidylyltransferase family protein [Bacteroidota bacterium]
MPEKIENILWLIPARAGSKSVPGKNIKPLNGMPLMTYRIKTALALSPAEKVWCSTDDKDYAEIAKKAGATIPFMRPAELATDTASSADVVLHAMDHAEKGGWKPDFLGLLEPTSPLVFKTDLLQACQRLQEDPQASAIVAVREARPNTIFIQDETQYMDELAQRLENRAKMGRQAFKRQITPSGGFYITRWDAFREKKTFYTAATLPYLLPEPCTLEIDDPIDWQFAEFLLEKEIVDPKKIF